MEQWRRYFRHGIAPLVENAQLEYVLGILKSDSEKMCQGDTVILRKVIAESGLTYYHGDLPPVSGCFVSLIHMSDEKLTANEVDAKFGPFLCRVGLNHGLSSHFINWFDDSPREEVRRELIAEIELVLDARNPKRSEPAKVASDSECESAPSIVLAG